MFVSNTVRCGRGVDVCGAPGRVDDVTAVNSTTTCGINSSEEEYNFSGFRLTEADVMDAEEVLMGSDLPHEERRP